MNIYEMYMQNGYRCGFWVKRDSWVRSIARIISIDGRIEGRLHGKPPYFNNLEVRGDVYLGIEGQMRWPNGGSGANQEIKSAGTGLYALVAVPTWWREAGS